jgi:hypothetical protein
MYAIGVPQGLGPATVPMASDGGAHERGRGSAVGARPVPRQRMEEDVTEVGRGAFLGAIDRSGGHRGLDNSYTSNTLKHI